MINTAITTKITTHKPPRIYIASGDTRELINYDGMLSDKDNHLVCAKAFVGKYLPEAAITAIRSAYLSEEENEMVHIVEIAQSYIPVAEIPTTQTQSTIPESTGLNMSHEA